MMVRIYCYNEPIFQYNAIVGNEVIEKNEQEILNEYWDHWKSLMDAKYGKNHELTTEENCIYDWIVVHWAWEKKITCYCELSSMPYYGTDFCEICDNWKKE